MSDDEDIDVGSDNDEEAEEDSNDGAGDEEPTSEEQASETEAAKPPNPSPILTVQCHAGPVNCFLLHQDLIYTGGADWTIRSFDKDLKTQTHIFSGHRTPVTALAFDEKHKVLVSGGERGVVKTWNIRTKECTRTILTQSTHTVTTLMCTPEHIVTCSGNGKIVFYPLAIEEGDGPLLTIGDEIVKAGICELLVNPGKKLTYTLYSSHDRVVEHREVTKADFQEHQRVLKAVKQQEKTEKMNRAKLDALASAGINETGKVAVGFLGTNGLSPSSRPGSAGTRSKEEGKNKGEESQKKGKKEKDGKKKKTKGKKDQSDVGKKSKSKKLSTPSYLEPSHKCLVWSMASDFEAGRLFCGTSEGSIHMWDLEEKKLMQSHEAHAAGILSIVLLDDKSFIITASADRSIRVWPRSDTELSVAPVHEFIGHVAPVTRVGSLAGALFSVSVDGTIRKWALDSVPRSGAGEQESPEGSEEDQNDDDDDDDDDDDGDDGDEDDD